MFERTKKLGKKVKEKLIATGAWVKRNVKKVLITIGVVGVAMAVSGGQPAEPQYITAPENNAFTMGVQNYAYSVAENSDEVNALMYMDDGKYIGFTPSAVYIDGKKVLNANKIQKIGDKYPDLFDISADLEIQAGGRRWTKLITINNDEILQHIPNDAETVEIEFIVETDFIIDGWNREDRLEINDTVRVGDFSYLEPAFAWDSWSSTTCEIIEEEEVCETEYNRIKLTSYFEKRGNKLYYVKVLPVDWLRDAEYPVKTDADVTYGLASEFESALTESISVTQTHDGGFIVLYEDETGDDVDVRAATVSGRTISWGADVEVVAAYNGNYNVTGIAQLETDKVVLAYSGGGNDGHVRIATISGYTITLEDSALEYETGDVEYPAVCGISATKFVIAFQDDSDSDNGKVRACNIDGSNAIDCGTLVEFVGDNDTERISCAKIDTNKFVTALNDEADSDKDKGKAFIGTISGDDTISLGAAVEFHDTAYEPLYINVSSIESNKFVLIFYTYPYGRILSATTSGDDISFSDLESPIGTISYHQSIAMVDSTHYVGVAQDGGANEKGISVYGTVDWDTNSTTIGDIEEWEGDHVGGSTSGANQGIDITLISDSKVVICYQNETDSGAGQCIIGDTPSAEPPASAPLRRRGQIISLKEELK